jgi:outer membrane protein insertion porin family
MRAGTSIAAVFLLLLAIVCPLLGEEGGLVRSVEVAGTQRPVELDELAGKSFDRDRVAREVKRLWATGWFDDIRVETAVTKTGVRLLFIFTERKRLYLRHLIFRPESQKRRIGLEPGDPVDTVTAKRLEGVFRRQLESEGYTEADVRIRLEPVDFSQADLVFEIEPGRRFHVGKVRFTGVPVFPGKDLSRAMQVTRTRRLLPGIPGLWKGWRTHEPYSRQLVESDLQRLHSFYLSRGYFDAKVRLAGEEFVGDAITLTVSVQAGKRYPVRRIVTPEGEDFDVPFLETTEEIPLEKLCRCLFQARLEAEQAGQMDFQTSLVIDTVDPLPAADEGAGSPDEEENVSLLASVEPGPAYRVGRIEFRGHHSFGDSTLRRALVLEEGEWFDRSRLRKSLARLSRMAFLEPLTEENVKLLLDTDGGVAHVVITVREKPRGLWTFSGPLTALTLSDPLQFAIQSRLPAIGSGALELSTYAFGLKLLSYPSLVERGLNLFPKAQLKPEVSLERPLLPGQQLLSGISLSPQAGWQGMVSHYGVTQARHLAQKALAGDGVTEGDLRVPLYRRTGVRARLAGKENTAGYLTCPAPKPKLQWLRAVGMVTVDLFLGGAVF